VDLFFLGVRKDTRDEVFALALAVEEAFQGENDIHQYQTMKG